MIYENKCSDCKKLITEGEASYSFHAWGKELCFTCQEKARDEVRKQRELLKIN